MDFLNQNGLYALLLLLPLILIYLIKPRPKDKAVPSLMFILGSRSRNILTSFFRRITSNFLLLLSIIIIVSVSLAIATPFFEEQSSVNSMANVIVIDTSASMCASQGSQTRMELAKRIARRLVEKRKNTVITTDSKASILALNAGDKEAKRAIDSVECTDSPTDLSVGLATAVALTNRPSNIHLISDFKFTQGQDPLVVIKQLSIEGHRTYLHPVFTNSSNVAITQAAITKYTGKVRIKNYDDEERDITVLVGNNGRQVSSYKMKLLPRSSNNFDFKPRQGENTIILDVKDGLNADNRAYFYIPIKEKVSILLITNKADQQLVDALKSNPNVELTIAEPPIIPKITQDIVIISNVNKKLILPGTFRDIKEHVEAGGSVIVAPQDDLGELKIGWLGMHFKGVGGYSDVIRGVKAPFTIDIDFSSVGKYLKAEVSNDTLVIEKAKDNTPLLTMRRLGEGRLIYYGIFDESSEFKQTPDYPLFWSELVDYLTGATLIKDYNFKTGTAVINDGRPLTLKRVGFFSIKQGGREKKIAVNLLDGEESSLNYNPRYLARLEEVNKETRKVKVRRELDVYLGALALLLLVVEALYLKKRGRL